MDKEKIIWEKLASARPTECGKLVKQMLKIKLNKEKGSKDE